MARLWCGDLRLRGRRPGRGAFRLPASACRAALLRLPGWRRRWLLALAVCVSSAWGVHSIRDYFPLAPQSVWTLADVDGEPADDEGFAWAVAGNAPETIGSHQAWAVGVSTVSPADSRNGDRLYWNFYNGGADLGLYGLYENAGVPPLAANQAIAFSRPLRVGAERMAAGWNDTTTADATFRVTVLPGVTIPVSGTVTAAAALAERREFVDTPLGRFYDVLVITLSVNGAAYGFSLPPLFEGTLFLARGVGLVRFVRNRDPASLQAQAIAGGQLGGVPIAPPPPPAPQGVTIVADDLETGENGDGARFTVVLDAPPAAPVALTLVCDDPAEVSLGPGGASVELWFTPEDWDVPQTVAVTGLDDAEWDGHQTCRVTFAIRSEDPDYAALDPAAWTLTFTNLDDENLDIEDYFVIAPGSQWHYVPFDEAAGAVLSEAGLSWCVEDVQGAMHGVAATAIRTDFDESGGLLDGIANYWSLSPSGDLLLHGVRQAVPIEQDVSYLGGTYHVVVPAQTVVFAEPLRVGARGMVAHVVLEGETTAALQVTGLPLISSVPVRVASRTELLGMRDRKRTALGTFVQVPVLSLAVSASALGETVQDQGGILFLARQVGVICQNAAGQPDAPVGLSLDGGTAGGIPIAADEADDGALSLTLRLQPGWNLISVPFAPENPDPGALFGDAILGRVWELRGRAFVPAAVIRPGVGYWVYRNPAFAPGEAAAGLAVRGFPAPASVRDAVCGWILAGPICGDPGAVLPLPVLSASGGAPVCWFAWVWQDGALVPADELRVGQGAWLLVESAGPLDLSARRP